MFKASQALLLFCALALGSQAAFPQSATISDHAPAFDAATIKPPDPAAPSHRGGFFGEPGGRVFFGGTLKMLLEDAFNLQRYQISGGPDWTASQWFEINAVPPDSSPSRNIKAGNGEPTAEQRLMLQSLLRDRFGFRFHFVSKQGAVYILTRGRKPLQLKPRKDPTSDPRFYVMLKAGAVADGEAVGGNITVGYLALRLSQYLQLPVLDETEITGSYDLHLPPNEPENHDFIAAVVGVVDRLGLTIRRSRGPIETLVIDRAEPPSAN